MKSYLVTFVLYKEEEDYNQIVEMIKSYNKWARIHPHAWVINTDKAATEVRTEIRESISNRCLLFVIDVTGAGWGSYGIPDTVAEWLKKNL